MKLKFLVILCVAIILPFATYVSADTPVINITSPTSNTIMPQGGDINIAWTSSGVNNVNIYLWSHSSINTVIAKNVPASKNIYTYIIPADTEAGDDYAIQVVDSATDENPGAKDLKSISIITPPYDFVSGLAPKSVEARSNYNITCNWHASFPCATASNSAGSCKYVSTDYNTFDMTFSCTAPAIGDIISNACGLMTSAKVLAKDPKCSLATFNPIDSTSVNQWCHTFNPASTLKPGVIDGSSKDISSLQRILNFEKLQTAVIPVNGRFDTITQTLLRKFQIKHDLLANGQVAKGDLTAKKLNAIYGCTPLTATFDATKSSTTQTIIIGQTSWFAAFKLANTSVNSLKVSKLVFHRNGTAGDSVFSSIKLYASNSNSIISSSPSLTGSDEVTFSNLSITIPANNSVTVMTDLTPPSDTAVGATVGLSINSTTDITANTSQQVTAGVFPVKSDLLTLIAPPATLSAKLVASSTTQSQNLSVPSVGLPYGTRATFNFSSIIGSQTITELKFSTTNGAVTSICTPPSPMGSVCAVTVNGVAYLTGLNIPVSASAAGINQAFLFSYAPVGAGGLTPGVTSLVSLNYVKSTNGSIISVTVPNINTPMMTLVSADSTTPSNTCTSFAYTAWSDCVNGTQTRTVRASVPVGCTGGNPDLMRSCVSQGQQSSVGSSLSLSSESKSNLASLLTTLKSVMQQIQVLLSQNQQ